MVLFSYSALVRYFPGTVAFWDCFGQTHFPTFTIVPSDVFVARDVDGIHPGACAWRANYQVILRTFPVKPSMCRNSALYNIRLYLPNLFLFKNKSPPWGHRRYEAATDADAGPVEQPKFCTNSSYFVTSDFAHFFASFVTLQLRHPGLHS